MLPQFNDTPIQKYRKTHFNKKKTQLDTSQQLKTNKKIKNKLTTIDGDKT